MRSYQSTKRFSDLSERVPPINFEEQTVFVVDDEVSTLDWMQRLLSSIRLKMEKFQSPDLFLKTITAKHTGCIVLDVRMPQMSGLEVQEHLIQMGITLPVIFLSAFGDIPMVLHAIRNGAFDFLEKPVREQTLLDSINLALRHNREQHQRDIESESLRSRSNSLTNRECDVLRLIAAGKPNKAIADELGVSMKTIEYRRANIMMKLNVSCTAELICAALTLNLT